MYLREKILFTLFLINLFSVGPNLSVWTQRAPAASPVVAPPYPVDSSRVVPGAAPLGFDQLNMPGASPYPPPAGIYLSRLILLYFNQIYQF